MFNYFIGRTICSHLSRIIITDNLKLPTRVKMRKTPVPKYYHPSWYCSRWGLPMRNVAILIVSSYLTFSPLPTRDCKKTKFYFKFCQNFIFCGTHETLSSLRSSKIKFLKLFYKICFSAAPKSAVIFCGTFLQICRDRPEWQLATTVFPWSPDFPLTFIP